MVATILLSFLTSTLSALSPSRTAYTVNNHRFIFSIDWYPVFMTKIDLMWQISIQIW